MPADPLAGLQRTSAVQVVEGLRSGSAEGLEISAVPPSRSSFGHSDGLALPSSQRSLPASVYRRGTTPSIEQRLPRQAEVS